MKPKVELATPEKCSNFLCESANAIEAVEKVEEVIDVRTQLDSSCSTQPDSRCSIIPIPKKLIAPSTNSVDFTTETEKIGAHCYPTATSIKNSKDLRKTYDLKQLFNYLYFGIAAISIFEVSRSGADIKCLSDYFYLGTIDFDPSVKMMPLLFLSAFFLIASLVAARSAVKATAQDASPFHFSRATRKILRSAAIILPMPFIVVTILSTIGYQCLVQADNACTKGNDNLAISYLNFADKLDPNLKEKVLSGKAMAYFDKREYATAADYATKALVLDPTDENALGIMGFGSVTIDAARAATLLNPNDGHSFRVLAEKEFELSHIPEALAAARRHAELHYDESGAKEFLARVLLEAGKAEEALNVIGSVLQSDADSQTHEIRAAILEKLGRSAEAQTEYDRAREMRQSEAVPVRNF
jgi:tetratricopeptide (TPR) repeat protein